MTRERSGTLPLREGQLPAGLDLAPDFSEAPVIVFWEVTRACALKCIHCRAEAQPYRHPLELSKEEGFRLLGDLASFSPRPVVVLTGGDPFLRPDLFELVEQGLGQGLIVALSPSATKMVSRRALERLAKLGLSAISLSLDGSKPEVHDSFRGTSGSFRRTQECIQDALATGLSLQINTTVSRHNLEDLPAIAELLGGLPGLPKWSVFFLVPTGRGQRDDVISPEEHERVYEWLYALSQRSPFRIKTTLGQHYRRVALQSALRQGESLERTWAQVARSATNDGKGACFISHVGEVYPSGFLPVSCGNVRRESVVDVYRSSPVFQLLRDPDALKGKCGRCPFRAVCGGCRARAYAYTGDYLEAEPFCIFEPAGAELLGATPAR